MYRELNGSVIRGTFAITSACKDPAAMLRWVDVLYSQEGATEALAGEAGKDYYVGADGTWSYAGDTQTSSSYVLYDLSIYDSGNMDDVTLPVRVMQKLGVQTLVVTNAAGGVNLNFQAGDLMLITDFINFAGRNPLIGPNLDAFGPRFPDMSRALDRDLQALAKQTAEELGITLREGVYCWLTGPTYETPAEIRMVRTLGADAVGMSTVPEIIVGKHGGMRVLGMSCITNMAAGVLDAPLNHQEVMEMGNKVKGTFRALLDGVIRKM